MVRGLGGRERVKQGLGEIGRDGDLTRFLVVWEGSGPPGFPQGSRGMGIRDGSRDCEGFGAIARDCVRLDPFLGIEDSEGSRRMG